jgi:hypothetical protein
VDARVCPARSEQLEFAREKLPSNILQLALYRLRVVLDLPAAISRAFVFKF